MGTYFDLHKELVYVTFGLRNVMFIVSTNKSKFIKQLYSGNADLLSKTAFSYRFRIVSFYAVSNAVWRKTAFPFSQSQRIDKNAVDRFKRSSLSFLLLTNQQPFKKKKTFLTVNRLTNEQRRKNSIASGWCSAVSHQRYLKFPFFNKVILAYKKFTFAWE